MTTALAQIQEEIVRLEERLKLLRTAETALQALEITNVEDLAEEGAPLPAMDLPSIPNPPGMGLAGAIRAILRERGAMDKRALDNGLNGRFKLGKGSVSSALQAMKTRGTVARSKAGKWILK